LLGQCGGENWYITIYIINNKFCKTLLNSLILIFNLGMEQPLVLKEFAVNKKFTTVFVYQIALQLHYFLNVVAKIGT